LSIDDPIGPNEAFQVGQRPRASEQVERVVSARVPLGQSFVEIWRYRELWLGLTRKELKIKYKNSVLGFFWSLLNPFISILVFYFVFQVVLKNGIPGFAILLVAGILVWNLFSGALLSATVSVVGNASIVKKVSFPKEVLALSSVGAATVHLFLQGMVALFFLAIFRRGPAIEYLPLLIPAILALLLLTSAFGILLAALNVRLRDMQHLVEIGLQVWFWATPIVYAYLLVKAKVAGSASTAYHVLWVVYRLNPVTPIVLTFQRAIYGKTTPLGGKVPCAAGSPPGCMTRLPTPILPQHAGPWWYFWQLGVVIIFSLALLAFAVNLFSRLEGNFAEEL
jgi:ABC-2 type transport system permease protein